MTRAKQADHLILQAENLLYRLKRIPVEATDAEDKEEIEKYNTSIFAMLYGLNWISTAPEKEVEANELGGIFDNLLSDAQGILPHIAHILDRSFAALAA